MRALRWAVLLLLSATAALCAAPPGPDAVWDAPADLRDRLAAALEGGDDATALQRVMQAAGAKPAALAFAKGLGEDAGYLGTRTEAGGVVTGTLYFPLRASNTDEPCAIDATGRLVRFTGPDSMPVVELQRDRKYRQLAKRDRTLECYPPLEPLDRVAAKDGFDLIAKCPLRTCPRCPERGTARVAYRFDAGGVYRGRRLLDVKRAR